MKLLLGLMLSLGLVGCGKQDPLDGFSEDIKNSQSKPKPEKPVPPDLLRIEAEDIMAFKEGEESQYRVYGRVFKDGLKYHVEIENPPADSAYDSHTGVFKWTPPAGTTTDQPQISFKMTARLIVDETPPVSISRDIYVVVQKRFSIPKIIKVDAPVEVCEREQKEITVVIEDLTSSEENPPILNFSDVKNEKSAVSYLSVVNKTWQKNGKWEFTVRFNGEGRELTQAEEKFHFSMKVISPFGHTSPSVSSYFTVQSDSAEPVISWPNEEVTVKSGAEFAIAFTIFDPGSSTSRISISEESNSKKWPGNAKLSVDEEDGVSYCRLTWEAPPGSGSYDLNLKATVRNDYGCQIQTKRFTRTFNLAR